MRNLTSLFFLLTFLGCANTKQLTISSFPNKAKVSYYDQSLKSYSPLGETPIDIKSKQKDLKIFDHDLVAFRIERSGFVTESFLYDTGTKNKTEYHAKLVPIEGWTNKNHETSSRLANDVVKKIQDINRLTLQKKHDFALKKISLLIEDYPKAPILYDIKGSIHILLGDKQSSIASLEKSLSLNPDNQETKQVLRELLK